MTHDDARRDVRVLAGHKVPLMARAFRSSLEQRGASRASREDVFKMAPPAVNVYVFTVYTCVQLPHANMQCGA